MMGNLDFDPANNVNPYWNRLAIDDPRAFFGRQRERQQLAQLIDRGQPVSIVGQRRIGKTSLLRSLSFPDLKSWSETFRFISIDGSYFADADEQGFLGFLLDQLEEELEISPLPVQRESLFEAAEQARSRQMRLAILIDEFDIIAYNERIASGQLFSFLRALVQEFRIPIVLVSRDGRLEPLLHNSAVGSPFWNIFTTFYLGPLTRDEARTMVCEPAEACNKPFAEDQVKEIFNLGGLHPFFLNIACTYAFNGYRGEELKLEFLRESALHFEYLVNQLDKKDLKKLCDIVADPKKVDLRIQADFQRRGLVLAGENGISKLFSSEFAEFLSPEPSGASCSEKTESSAFESLGNLFPKNRGRGNG
jgi:hypothetical protein